MTLMRSTAVAVMLACAVAGCAGRNWNPFSTSDNVQERRLPPGAVEYVCAGNMKLVVRFETDAKSAWVFHPDRQFRLDRVGSGGDRFSNAATILLLQGDTVSLEEEGKRVFADCKRSAAG